MKHAMNYVCRVMQRDKDDERWQERALYGDRLGGEGPGVHADNHEAAAKKAALLALLQDRIEPDRERAVAVLAQGPDERTPRAYHLPLFVTVGEATEYDSNMTGQIRGASDVMPGWTAQDAARLAEEGAN